MVTLKSLLLFTCLFFNFSSYCQEAKILTWNIAHLGKTKDASELEFMAKVMKDFDIIAIQEVVAVDPAGAKAVAKIADLLNRMGAQWDYKVSDPTNSPGKRKERYAFIWKKSSVKMSGKPWLDKDLSRTICREPYVCRFSIDGEIFLLANYHSIPHADKPQFENELLIKKLPKLYPHDHIIIAGDFNINSNDSFWSPLHKLDLHLLPFNAKTTLRRDCTPRNKFTYRSHAIDFFIFEKNEILVSESGVLDYIGNCSNLEAGRMISDHLPAWVLVEL